MRVLSRAELNRALLARNWLLERQPASAYDAIEHLVGLQAQEPQEPFTGLFSRLTGIDPREVDELLTARRVVRTLLMRRTLHLVTAADCLAWRPLHQPMLLARMRAVLAKRLTGVDETELAVAGRPLFHAEPLTLGEAGRRLAGRWPEPSARDLGDALSSLVEVVQVPPRGLWGQPGPARNTTIAAWLGEYDATTQPDPAVLVRRYLTAFGPAASADVRAWSGLSGIREVLEGMPDLRTFRDERHRLLYDVPDGPLPDPDVPAPPRFLPAFDNAVLGYDDRSRIIDREHRGLSVAGARFLLVDGRVAGTWTLRTAGDAAVLEITPLTDVTDRDAVEAEGARLVRWHVPDRPGRIAWSAN